MTDAPKVTKHSDDAWGIAAQYSYSLASDTRGLAGQIDRAITAAYLRGLEDAARIAEKNSAKRKWEIVAAIRALAKEGGERRGS